MASAQERRAFGAALAAALKTKGLSQTQFAEQLGVTQSLISAWKRGEAEPPPERVFVAEQRLDLRPGTLSRHLGYVPVGVDPATLDLDVVASIQQDPNLSREARRRLVGLYKLEIDGAGS